MVYCRGNWEEQLSRTNEQSFPNPERRSKEQPSEKMDDRQRLLEGERLQIEQIRELDFEELQVEEVESLDDSDDDDNQRRPIGRIYEDTTLPAEFTFDTSLSTLHSYLGEVEDTHHRLSSFDGGTLHQLPLFYFEGVVLFPEAILPLRVVQPNYVAAIERALSETDQGTSFTIGVVGLCRDPVTARYKFATTGTTAEIRQYRRLEGGSINAVTRGQQRFRLKRWWTDVEGVTCGEVRIIEEDLPLRTPRDVFGKWVPVNTLKRLSMSGESSPDTSPVKWNQYENGDGDLETHSEDSFESALSPRERRLHHFVISSAYKDESMNESTSSDDDVKFVSEAELQLRRSDRTYSNENSAGNIGFGNYDFERQTHKVARPQSQWKASRVKCSIPRAFWPEWVYRMYDSYALAERAAGVWKQVVKAPSMDGFVKKPDLLSFHIASKIPVSESTRQELLEIDGTSYRLRREIELLECCDRIRCKMCQVLIGKRSDMLIMSTNGPLGAYVNPNGCVHEVMTLHKVNNLSLIGHPQKRYCWFPGYAWTIANCTSCDTHMGWLYTATNTNLKPRSFWGVRSSQVADEMRK